MNKLNTPLGKLTVILDGKKVDFKVAEVKTKNNTNVDKCYLLSLPINKNRKVFLHLDTVATGYDDGGEFLSSLSYESQNIKMNISTIDYEYHSDEKVLHIYSDYRNNNIVNERLDIIPIVYFAVSWKKTADKDDISTWLAADALLYIDKEKYFSNIYKQLNVKCPT